MKNKRDRIKEVVLEYKERKISGGVYKICNTKNGKVLIMSDIDLKSSENKFNFFKKTNMPVYNKLTVDWKRYGSNIFEFEILEEIEISEGQSIKSFKEEIKKLKDTWDEKFDKSILY